MEIGVFEVIAGLGILFLGLHYYLTSNFHYWKKRGVKGPKPIPIFGNFKDAVFGKINGALLMQKYYNEFKSESLIGIYAKSSPMLIVKDPDIIKDVLIRDFNLFPDRGVTSVGKNDTFSHNLVNLEYERWRPLRNKLSPVFTSGKLKNMFNLITDCADQFEKYVEKVAEKGEPVECRELTAKYTTDAIGICAFGLNANSLGDENSGFRKSCRDLMDSSFSNALKAICREWCPRLYGLFRPLVYNKATDFLVNSLKETLEYRKINSVSRNDFIDLLMDLQDKPEKLADFEFTDILLTAQALTFFLAGAEPSSITVSNALYELALNQHTQDKLREEIKEVYEKDGKLTYDNIKNMKYLDKVLKETLRKYPSGTIIQRNSAAEYTFRGTEVTIPKNIKIIIPTWGIHRDPDIYPDPDLFDPERFSEEYENKRHPINFLPFGDGPHNCIGLRFANYVMKIGIVTLIHKFRFDVCDKTSIPYRVHPRSIIPTAIGGINLIISKL